MDRHHLIGVCLGLLAFVCLLGGMILANLKPYLRNARIARQFNDGKWNGNAYLLLKGEMFAGVLCMNGKWNLTFARIARGIRFSGIHEGFMPTVKILLMPLYIPEGEAREEAVKYMSFQMKSRDEGGVDLLFTETVDLKEYSITVHFRAAYDPKEVVIATEMPNHAGYITNIGC